MSDLPAIVDARGLCKSYEEGRIVALDDVDLRIEAGEFVAIVGPSGCGKSTLLHAIGTLDRCDRGAIRIAGVDVAARRDLSSFRALHVGFVFQMHNLLPTLTARDNVEAPMLELGVPRAERRSRSTALLDLVDLGERAGSLPRDLSGGERQRVALARALANDPDLLLADEPTGNLDSASGRRVLELIEAVRAQRGLTVLLVTHDMTIARRADRIVHMLDGRIVAAPDDAGGASPAAEPAHAQPTATGGGDGERVAAAPRPGVETPAATGSAPPVEMLAAAGTSASARPRTPPEPPPSPAPRAPVELPPPLHPGGMLGWPTSPGWMPPGQGWSGPPGIGWVPGRRDAGEYVVWAAMSLLLAAVAFLVADVRGLRDDTEEARDRIAAVQDTRDDSARTVARLGATVQQLAASQQEIARTQASLARSHKQLAQRVRRLGSPQGGRSRAARARRR